MKPPGPSENLLAGRREADDVAGYSRKGDLIWAEAQRSWLLRFELAVVVNPADIRDHSVAELTSWVALISPEYPSGSVAVFPSNIGGLTSTYPHQKPNLAPRNRESWRRGELCLATPFSSLAGETHKSSNSSAANRLRWHVQRTREWIDAARRGELLREGEPFELPTYASDNDDFLVFDGNAASTDPGPYEKHAFGLATIGFHKTSGGIHTLMDLRAPHSGAPPLLRCAWGRRIRDPDRYVSESAIWVRVGKLPVCTPWRAPATWGELAECLASAGADLQSVVEGLAEPMRDGRQHLLLIGAPIPSFMGGPSATLHWLALKLPVLSFGKKQSPGYRPGIEAGYRLRDRKEVLTSSRPLSWMRVENWAPSELQSRGRATDALVSQRILVIGAGSLGAAICELLIREGCADLTILDGDILQAGNLVRHSLTISDLGMSKAIGLANRLNAVSPHSAVVGFPERFPPARTDAIAAARAATLVIDCSANDGVINAMGHFDWGGEKSFVSCSIGLFAKRTLVFCAKGERFPENEFREMVDPWLEKDRNEFADNQLPWEGIGCWHPVFPARASDMTLSAVAALRRIEQAANTGLPSSRLDVFEREEILGNIELRHTRECDRHEGR